MKFLVSPPFSKEWEKAIAGSIPALATLVAALTVGPHSPRQEVRGSYNNHST